MSASPHYTIHCDTEGCGSTHRPPAEQGWNVVFARRHAVSHGWTRPHRSGTKVDLCPTHRRAER